MKKAKELFLAESFNELNLKWKKFEKKRKNDLNYEDDLHMMEGVKQHFDHI
jgi:hypothetical protein